MNFYDIISPFADGHRIISDNAKQRYHPSISNLNNNNPIESSMPPLERCSYRTDRQRKRRINRLQKLQQTMQE